MQYTLDSVAAPVYAPDGGRGYGITVSWSGMFLGADMPKHRQTGTLYGWTYRAANGRVFASIDGNGWQYVTMAPVADADWSDAWIWSHGSDILEAAR